MKVLFKQRVDVDTLLLANILDYLAILTWFQTKDGKKNRNRPKSFVKILTGKQEQKQIESFNSREEFEKEWQRLQGA